MFKRDMTIGVRLSVWFVLTLSRIFAVPILVFLLWRPAPLDYAITFVLYAIVGITDSDAMYCN